MAASQPESKLPCKLTLTKDERRVIEDARKGHATVFDPPENIEDPTTCTTIRARVLVGLLLHPEQPLAPKGLRLQHARITGRLDFTHASLTAPLQLENCLFLEGVVFADVTCPALAFPHSIFKNGFDAPRSRIENTLNLTHTTITGQLNLENTAIRVDLNLEGATLTLPPTPADTTGNHPRSVLDAGSAQIGSSLHLNNGFHAHGTVNLAGAKIGGELDCSDGTFRNPGRIALNAEDIKTSRRVFLPEGFMAEGEVLLSGAKIGGRLECRNGKFHNPGGTALNARSIETSGSVLLDEGFVAKGEVVLSGAQIGAQLSCQSGKFHNPGGTALNARSIETSGGVLLDEGFVAKGEVVLSGAQIGAQLSCQSGKFHNPGRIALKTQNVETGRGMFLNGKFEAWGAVRLAGMKINGQLNCRNGKFHNPGGTALHARSIETSGGVLLDEGFVAKGEVVLSGAQIGAQLSCRNGEICSPFGTALDAQNIETKADVYLKDGFVAEGEVVLSGAQIGGRLDCRNGKFQNSCGKALNAKSVKTSRSVYLAEEFVAKGEVVLLGAQIGGQLFCSGGKFQNPKKIALHAQNIETKADVYLKDGFVAEGEVNLDSARIGGQLNLQGGIFGGELVLAHVVALKLVDNNECWPKPDMVFLDGFQYEEIADESLVRWQDRLVWLKQQKEFVPGPYEQLAKVYRERGDAHAVRKVLIAKHKRQIQSVKRSPVRLRLTGMSKVWRRHLLPHFQWLFGGLVGYGHAPWRAAWGLAGLVFFAWVMFLCAADSNRMVPVEQPHDAAAFADATKGERVHADECTYEVEYPCFHTLWYAVDVAVPLVDLRQQSYWAPTGGYRWVMWIVIVAGWLLVSAVAIGLTFFFRGSGV